MYRKFKKFAIVGEDRSVRLMTKMFDTADAAHNFGMNELYFTDWHVAAPGTRLEIGCECVGWNGNDAYHY